MAIYAMCYQSQFAESTLGIFTARDSLKMLGPNTISVSTTTSCYMIPFETKWRFAFEKLMSENLVPIKEETAITSAIKRTEPQCFPVSSTRINLLPKPLFSRQCPTHQPKLTPIFYVTK